MATIEYKVGEAYKFIPREMGRDSRDNEYLMLLDEQGEREYRIYPQMVKFQEDDLPPRVMATVRSIDVIGRIVLRIDEGTMIREHYQEGKAYAFHITDSRDDPNTDAHYYVVEDDFARHRLYRDESEKYQKGGDCILRVKKFNDKGFLVFEEPDVAKETKAQVEQPAAPAHEQHVPQQWKNAPVLDVADEGTRLEFKTSIVFVPGEKHEANIDAQLDTIIRELCAFMNTEGGELYIGVHDKTKRVVGVKDDYAHLNDGEDRFAGSYSQSRDGYQLKIRNTIDRKCTSVANSLIEIEFKELEGVEYCKVTAKKARRPIWFNDTQLWIRQGCRLKQLKGDEISFFITDTMTVTIQNQLEIDGVDTRVSALTKEELEEILHKIVNVRKQVDVPLPPPPSLDEVKEWVNWRADGCWKWTNEKLTDPQYCIHVPVLKKYTDPVILFCYESGRVSCMKYSDFRRGTHKNKLEIKKTWNLDAGQPINILIAEPSSLLVGYSVDYNGVKYVKFHDITDFNTTASPANAGAPFAPDRVRMTGFKVISGAYRDKLAHLKCTKRDRSNKEGEPIDSPTFANEIALLNSIQ